MITVKALVTSPFLESSLEELREAGIEIVYRSWLDSGELHLGESLLAELKDGGYNIVIVEGDEIKEEIINACEFKLIASVRSSPNNIAVAAATARGVPVISAPGRNAIAVAELTITLILAQARRIVRADRMLKNDFMVDDFGDFAEIYAATTGIELHGKTAGIIGLGRIGVEVAKRLKVFGVSIVAYDPYISEERAKEVDAEIVTLEELLKRSDIVTVHCAPTEETQGLIGKEQFAMMKPTAIFVNTARASITDEYALLDALKTGIIGGAGLDVFSMEPVDCDNIFLELDNVTVTPHVGGNTLGTIRRQSQMITRDIIAFLNGEMPDNILNPEVLANRE